MASRWVFRTSGAMPGSGISTSQSARIGHRTLSSPHPGRRRCVTARRPRIGFHRSQPSYERTYVHASLRARKHEYSRARCLRSVPPGDPSANAARGASAHKHRADQVVCGSTGKVLPAPIRRDRSRCPRGVHLESRSPRWNLANETLPRGGKKWVSAARFERAQSTRRVGR